MTLEELDRLEKAATPGPLSVKETLSKSIAGFVDIADADCNILASMFIREGPNAKHVEDANVLVAARNALPKLLAVAKAAKALRDTYRDGCFEWAPLTENEVERLQEVLDERATQTKALDEALAEMEKA